MKQVAKVDNQVKNTEKQQDQKSSNQSPETATLDLANLAQTGLQHLSPAAVVRLSGMVGNRAVASLMAQRSALQPDVQREGEEEEEDFGGARFQREGEEEEEDFGGARTRREGPEDEEEVQRRRQAEQSPSQVRGAPRVAGLSAAIGDSFNVDGEGLYSWDRPMSAADVRLVVNDLVTNQSALIRGKTIYIFSGTHGNSVGNLNPTGAAGFVGEDQATANTVMSAPTTPAGTQIEVIDVPNSYSTKSSLTNVFSSTNYIRILAWCYSKRSFNNSATIKSKWWPAPDNY